MIIELAEIQDSSEGALQTLDGPRLTFPEDATLAAALRQARARLLQDGWMVQAAYLDGLQLSAADEERLQESATGRFEKLELRVSTVPSHIRETLLGCAGAFPELTRSSRRIAQAIRDGKLTQAYRWLGELCENLSFIAGACRSCRRLIDQTARASAGPAPRASSDPAGKPAWHDQLEQDLQEILIGVRDQDHVRISDVLDYELAGHLENLRLELIGWEACVESPEAPPVPKGVNWVE